MGQRALFNPPPNAQISITPTRYQVFSQEGIALPMGIPYLLQAMDTLLFTM